MGRVAVIAVTHDSGADMPAWLDAVDALPQREELEVCVVDSGSSPEERERLEALTRGRVSRLVLRPNLGYGGACNAGARSTTAPVLLFTTPDVRLRSIPRWAETLAGTIVGCYVEQGQAVRPAGFAVMPFARRQAAHLVLGGRSRTYACSAVDPKWVSGGALMISRDDLDRLGGWAEDYFLYFEDADLCLRHRRAGGRIEVSPEFLVQHPSDTDRRGIEGVAYRSGRRFVAKHQGRRYVMALWVFLLAGYLPRRVARAALRRLAASDSGREHVRSIVLDTVAPSRIERRLGVPPDRAPAPERRAASV
jgi:N-acetylglucosaminyl-diphospho-decaprenol L-rhamnosyltransferase